MDTLEVIRTVIAGAAALGALYGGYIAWSNYQNAVRWKRAELASGHLKELDTNKELLFACRALDWDGGLLVVPESLRPLLGKSDEKQAIIEHDKLILQQAMQSDLSVREMLTDARLQIYRTALDSLLSWFSLVRKALDRDLFEPADIEPIAWWLLRIDRAKALNGFIRDFGYTADINDLKAMFEASMRILAKRASPQDPAERLVVPAKLV